MFENLVESSSHKDDIARKGSFIGVTALIYGVLMLAFFVAGIYWYDAHLDEQTLELTTLVAPVPVPQQQKQEEQKQEAKPAKTEANVDVRKELIADVPPPPASTPTPPRAPISGGVLNGKAINLPKPGYPPIARAAHAAGTVVVQVLIDENGNVVSAHAMSGHPLLQGAAVGAARQAKFSPTKLSGQPVKVTGVIQYNFVAQ